MICEYCGSEMKKVKYPTEAHNCDSLGCRRLIIVYVCTECGNEKGFRGGEKSS